MGWQRFFLLFFILNFKAFATDYELFNLSEDEREKRSFDEVLEMIEGGSEIDLSLLSCDLPDTKPFFKYIIPENTRRDSITLMDGEVEVGLNAKWKEHRSSNISKIQSVIKYLRKKSPNAERLISLLQRAPYKVYIQVGSRRSVNHVNLTVKGEKNINNAHALSALETGMLLIDTTPLSSLGSSSRVNWNPLTQTSRKLQAVTLAHELYHAYEAAQGKLDSRFVTGEGLEMNSVMEFRAVYFENLVRKDLKVKTRDKFKETDEGEIKNLWIKEPCLNLAAPVTAPAVL